jgi:hypothetical protein
MRLFLSCAAVVATAIAFVPSVNHAQAPAQGQEDANRAVAGGGIKAAGWMGVLDAAAQKAGETVNNALLTQQGNVLRVTTGPAITYWHPNNRAVGDYTVKATFNEPKYMNLNNHPHPYGIVIAGNDMGTPTQSYMYCAAYGNGTFIVRGFGPAPFQLNGRRGGSAPSVVTAAGPGASVTQEIAMSVKGNDVTCTINGQVVATYQKTAIVTPGQLKSTDGVYGIRFAHNTEGTVTGLAMTKN